MLSRIKGIVQKANSIFQNAKTVQEGFKSLKQTKQTPKKSYEAMRQLFVLTNGRSNDIISKFIKQKKYDNVNANGILDIDSSAKLKSIADDIRENGYHIFESHLPLETINSIIAYAKSATCTFRKISNDAINGDIVFSEEGIFDEQHPQSPLYQFSRQKIIDNTELQKLIFDQSILALAQEYLDTKPIMDLVAMWWSVPFEGRGKSEAAQMYHFDLDKIKFLKFFFYLTDVDGETGPHCYVKGSHKKLPRSLQKEGRMTDEEVRAAFGQENLLELCGKKGTIMAVDTRGLHKGKDLTRDKRLIFQVEFSNSMFGQYYPPCKKPVLSPELEKVYQTYKYTYQDVISI